MFNSCVQSPLPRVESPLIILEISNEVKEALSQGKSPHKMQPNHFVSSTLEVFCSRDADTSLASDRFINIETEWVRLHVASFTQSTENVPFKIDPKIITGTLLRP